MNGLLARVKNYWYPEEFVVDERTVSVFTAAPEIAETRPETGTINDLMGRAATNDLLTQVSALLQEQVRLAEKAHVLAQSKSGDGDFIRFVRSILPFMDNFAHMLDLARENPPSPEMDNWLKSVESLYFRMVKILESNDVRFINSIGQRVNLDIHEVIEYRPSSVHPHDTVMKEVAKGVVYKDRLIRDAKVVVACNQ